MADVAEMLLKIKVNETLMKIADLAMLAESMKRKDVTSACVMFCQEMTQAVGTEQIEKYLK